jgi:hypothetical protein
MIQILRKSGRKYLIIFFKYQTTIYLLVSIAESMIRERYRCQIPTLKGQCHEILKSFQ